MKPNQFGGLIFESPQEKLAAYKAVGGKLEWPMTADQLSSAVSNPTAVNALLSKIEFLINDPNIELEYKEQLQQMLDSYATHNKPAPVDLTLDNFSEVIRRPAGQAVRVGRIAFGFSILKI